MQIALITGSGRKGNIGFKTAKQLGQQGYHVILAARKPAATMEKLVKLLTDSGVSASWTALDLLSEKSVVWAATLPDDGPTGGFFRDGSRLPW